MNSHPIPEMSDNCVEALSITYIDTRLIMRA